jgi:hypothetical protein
MVLIASAWSFRSQLPGQAPATESPRETRKAESASAVALTTSAPLSAAATRNNVSRNELQWSFGGRVQRGWEIYEPLIRVAVGAPQQAGDQGLSEALARWQKSRGLRQTGVLDEQSWYRMISDFQAPRIKERDHPPSDRLLVGPARDFYHPERPDELRQVEKTTFDAYKRMVAAAAKDQTLGLKTTSDGQLDPEERFLKIISAYRSRERQEQLRREDPAAGRGALATNSPHFTGRALDLYVGGEPVRSTDSNRLLQSRTAVYRWLVKNAGSFGFRPYFYEPWHWEYVFKVN